MSATRTTRDWRGIKFKLSAMENMELMEVLIHAMSAEEQLQAFMREILAELARRVDLVT